MADSHQPNNNNELGKNEFEKELTEQALADKQEQIDALLNQKQQILEEFNNMKAENNNLKQQMNDFRNQVNQHMQQVITQQVQEHVTAMLAQQKISSQPQSIAPNVPSQQTTAAVENMQQFQIQPMIIDQNNTVAQAPPVAPRAPSHQTSGAEGVMQQSQMQPSVLDKNTVAQPPPPNSSGINTQQHATNLTHEYPQNTQKKNNWSPIEKAESPLKVIKFSEWANKPNDKPPKKFRTRRGGDQIKRNYYKNKYSHRNKTLEKVVDLQFSMAEKLAQDDEENNKQNNNRYQHFNKNKYHHY